MIRPIVAIIRSLSFDTLKVIYIILYYIIQYIILCYININNLKCVEWQRPDDGHYRPKHAVLT